MWASSWRALGRTGRGRGGAGGLLPTAGRLPSLLKDSTPPAPFILPIDSSAAHSLLHPWGFPESPSSFADDLKTFLHPLLQKPPSKQLSSLDDLCWLQSAPIQDPVPLGTEDIVMEADSVKRKRKKKMNKHKHRKLRRRMRRSGK